MKKVFRIKILRNTAGVLPGATLDVISCFNKPGSSDIQKAVAEYLGKGYCSVVFVENLDYRLVD